MKREKDEKVRGSDECEMWKMKRQWRLCQWVDETSFYIGRRIRKFVVASSQSIWHFLRSERFHKTNVHNCNNGSEFHMTKQRSQLQQHSSISSERSVARRCEPSGPCDHAITILNEEDNIYALKSKPIFATLPKSPTKIFPHSIFILQHLFISSY